MPPLDVRPRPDRHGCFLLAAPMSGGGTVPAVTDGHRGMVIRHKTMSVMLVVRAFLT